MLKEFFISGIAVAALCGLFSLQLEGKYRTDWKKENYDTWKELAEVDVEFSEKVKGLLERYDHERKLEVRRIFRSTPVAESSLELAANIFDYWSEEKPLGIDTIAVVSDLLKSGIANWTSFSLQFNYIGGDGIRYLCNEFSNPEITFDSLLYYLPFPITFFSLEGNNLVDEDVCFCLKKLEHKQMVKLHFDFNKLTDKSITCIEKFIQNGHIEVLDLFWNNFSLQGLMRLLSLQSSNKDDMSIWLFLPSL